MSPDAAAPAVVVELSPNEAKRVLAALRQYEPYWTYDSDVSPLEQLAAIREEITSVIWKLELAVYLGDLSGA